MRTSHHSALLGRRCGSQALILSRGRASLLSHKPCQHRTRIVALSGARGDISLRLQERSPFRRWLRCSRRTPYAPPFGVLIGPSRCLSEHFEGLSASPVVRGPDPYGPTTPTLRWHFGWNKVLMAVLLAGYHVPKVRFRPVQKYCFPRAAYAPSRLHRQNVSLLVWKDGATHSGQAEWR